MIFITSVKQPEVTSAIQNQYQCYWLCYDGWLVLLTECSSCWLH